MEDYTQWTPTDLADMHSGPEMADEITRLRAENADQAAMIASLTTLNEQLAEQYNKTNDENTVLQRKLDEAVKRAFYSGHLHGWMRGDAETAEEGFSLYLDLTSIRGEA